MRTSPAQKKFWNLVKKLSKWPKHRRNEIESLLKQEFEKTCAVMWTDLTGFSKRTQNFGINHFLRLLFEMDEVCLPILKRFRGIHIKTEADSYMFMFPSVASALRAAIEVNKQLRDLNDIRNEENKLEICIGIGFGPIYVVGHEDMFGEQVNFASKLGEDVAASNEILITLPAHHQLTKIEKAISRLPEIVNFEKRRSKRGTAIVNHKRVHYSFR